MPEEHIFLNSSSASRRLLAWHRPCIRVLHNIPTSHLIKQLYCFFNPPLIAESINECSECDRIRLNTQFEHLTQDRDSKMNMAQATKRVNQYI
ncbi:hypothetical protein NC651_012598 [Populus alba x Populus x berolinensis]|nr:hypothetical protein NC651_012598 [Populus alba x Populus x berolinensis]